MQTNPWSANNSKSRLTLVSMTVKFGILGQVWYLIVSIPDLCNLTYFDKATQTENISKVNFSQNTSFYFASHFRAREA